MSEGFELASSSRRCSHSKCAKAASSIGHANRWTLYGISARFASLYCSARFADQPIDQSTARGKRPSPTANANSSVRCLGGNSAETERENRCFPFGVQLSNRLNHTESCGTGGIPQPHGGSHRGHGHRHRSTGDCLLVVVHPAARQLTRQVPYPLYKLPSRVSVSIGKSGNPKATSVRRRDRGTCVRLSFALIPGACTLVGRTARTRQVRQLQPALLASSAYISRLLLTLGRPARRGEERKGSRQCPSQCWRALRLSCR